jgi:hypothetical protein
LIEYNITDIYRDNEPLSRYDTFLQGLSGEVYIKEDELELGDKIAIVKESDSNEEYRESFYISSLNKELLKNLVVEAEIEFKDFRSQWIEFIVRGISKWDTSYTIDECYVFGYKNGDFYFAKRGYHQEGELSYPYKQVFDLTKPGDDTIKYFVNLQEDQIEKLQLDDYKLNVNERYQIRCSIIDENVKIEIKNTNKMHSQIQSYEWFTVFSDVTIMQNINDISNRTVSMEETISVFEPFTVIDGSGFYGFSVPNSHVNIYRYKVIDKAVYNESELYDNEEYSRKIASEFSVLYNSNEETKLNSVNIGEEIAENYKEITEFIGDVVEFEQPIDSKDIYDIKVNNLTIKKDEIFDSRTLNIEPMDKRLENDVISCFIDKNDKEHLKQKEIYLHFDEKTDGVSKKYKVPEKTNLYLNNYPNSKIGDVIIEVDPELIYNTFNKVGVKENFDDFVDNKELNKLFSRRKLYMETYIRGVPQVIEVGVITDNNFLFNIDEEYTKPNHSYQSIWDYNLANFINDFIIRFSDFISQNTLEAVAYRFNETFGTEYVTDDIQAIYDTLLTLETKREEIGISLGEAIVNANEEIIKYFNEKEYFLYENFNANDLTLDPIARSYMREGLSEKSLRMLFYFYNFSEMPEIVNLFSQAFKKSSTFSSLMGKIIDMTKIESYQVYIDFRQSWIEGLNNNTILSTDGVSDRKFFTSVFQDEYDIENGYLVFQDTKNVGRSMKMRIFYDNSFIISKNYDRTESNFKIPENVKELHENEDEDEKGITEFVNYIDKQKIEIINSNGVIFSIIPDTLNEDGEQLYCELNHNVPFVSDSNLVKRYSKVPLVKLSNLIKQDFESSKEQFIFPQTQENFKDFFPTYCVSISSSSNGVEEHCYESEYERDFRLKEFSEDTEVVPISAYDGDLEYRYVFDEWNREVDLIDTRTEVISGYWNQFNTKRFWENIENPAEEIKNFDAYFLKKYNSCASFISGGSSELVDITGKNLIPSISGSLTPIGISGLEDYNCYDSDKIYFKYDDIRYYPLNEGIKNNNYNYNSSITILTDISGGEYMPHDDISMHFMTSVIEEGVINPLENNKYFGRDLGLNIPVIDSTLSSINSMTNNILEESENYFDEESSKYLTDKRIIDRYLNMSEWFNFNESKLGFYYTDVLKEICNIKSNNRYYSEKIELTEESDPFDINNWFDGFYSGELLPLKDLFEYDMYRYKVVDGKLANKTLDEINQIKITHNNYVDEDGNLDESVKFYAVPGFPSYNVDNYSIPAAITANNIFNNFGSTEEYDIKNLVFEENDIIVIDFSFEEEVNFNCIEIVDLNLGNDEYLTIQYLVNYGDRNEELHTWEGEWEELYTFTRDSKKFVFGDFNVKTFRFIVDKKDHNTFIRVKQINFLNYGADISGLSPELVHFGRYYGNPWGSQNSRRHMIEQLRNTISNKFDGYSIYYADLTDSYYGEKYLRGELNSRLWDTETYKIIKYEDPLESESEMGIGGTQTFRYLDNPYVDPKNKYYQFARSVIVNGNVLFRENDFTDYTNLGENYSKESYLAVSKEKNNILVEGVFKELKKGRDIFWTYNSFLTIKDEIKKYISIGSNISIEYEYTVNYETENRNIPKRISQIISIGRVSGDKNQKFGNPEMIKTQKNVSKFNINRVWIDDLEIENFSIQQIANQKYELKLDLPEFMKSNKDVSIRYDESNYQELKSVNKIIQTFKNNEYVPWFWDVYTKDEEGSGYIKKPNEFRGFVADGTKFTNDVVFHMDESMDLDTISTSDIGTGGDLLRPIRYGNEDQDILQLNTIKRKNNFVFSFDFIYDSNIEREMMRFDVIFKGMFTKVSGLQQLTDYYALTFGIDKGITLSSRKVDPYGNIEQDVLAQIQDIGANLIRDVFYTVKVSVMKDIIKVYFNKRNEEEKFYFSVDLKKGHKDSSLEYLASNQFGGLNVLYNDPRFYINGDMFGFKAMTHKINFTNFGIEFYDPNNKTFGNPFSMTNYDKVVSSLKNKFDIEGELKSIKKTTSGYEYILIDNTLFSRRNGGDFDMHNMFVEKFEVFKDKCYIQEKVVEDAIMSVINVYIEGFKLIQNIIVDGRHLANETLISYLAETNRRAIKLEKIDDQIFISTDEITSIPDDWEDMTATWDEYYAPWNLY